MRKKAPMVGTPETAHLVLRADGHWYALIVCETEQEHEHLPSACDHPDIGIDVRLKVFLICPFCGFVADRDVNAALNILRAGAPPSGTVSDGRPDELRSPVL